MAVRMAVRTLWANRARRPTAMALVAAAAVCAACRVGGAAAQTTVVAIDNLAALTEVATSTGPAVTASGEDEPHPDTWMYVVLPIIIFTLAGAAIGVWYRDMKSGAAAIMPTGRATLGDMGRKVLQRVNSEKQLAATSTKLGPSQSSSRDLGVRRASLVDHFPASKLARVSPQRKILLAGAGAGASTRGATNDPTSPATTGSRKKEDTVVEFTTSPVSGDTDLEWGGSPHCEGQEKRQREHCPGGGHHRHHRNVGHVLSTRALGGGGGGGDGGWVTTTGGIGASGLGGRHAGPPPPAADTPGGAGTDPDDGRRRATSPFASAHNIRVPEDPAEVIDLDELTELDDVVGTRGGLQDVQV